LLTTGVETDAKYVRYFAGHTVVPELAGFLADMNPNLEAETMTWTVKDKHGDFWWLSRMLDAYLERTMTTSMDLVEVQDDPVATDFRSAACNGFHEPFLGVTFARAALQSQRVPLHQVLWQHGPDSV
jgi:hypothetical protein